jgi:hypothetical protein
MNHAFIAYQGHVLNDRPRLTTMATGLRRKPDAEPGLKSRRKAGIPMCGNVKSESPYITSRSTENYGNFAIVR